MTVVDTASGDWRMSDAWLLAASSDTKQGAALTDLLATADGISHAIPTRDELASSLGALIGAGLVEVVDHRFRTTSAGRTIKRHWKGGLFGWSTSIMPHLQTLERPSSQYPITDEEVRTAYRDYLRRTRR